MSTQKTNHHMRISEAGDMAYQNAIAHGFYDDYQRLRDLVAKFGTEDDKKFLRSIWINHRLMLVVTELAEGCEAVRKDNYSGAAKSNGLGEELADAQIRLLDLFVHTEALIGTDNESAIVGKMLYNASRPHKHGKTL